MGHLQSTIGGGKHTSWYGMGTLAPSHEVSTVTNKTKTKLRADLPLSYPGRQQRNPKILLVPLQSKQDEGCVCREEQGAQVPSGRKIKMVLEEGASRAKRIEEE
jgi:hypothetical protein